jgi:hypothetical protein
MTAEEVIKKDWVLLSLNKNELSHIQDAMKQYAQVKCAEQRGLCAAQLQVNMFTEKIQLAIIGAPEPKFD